ncbi:SMI1/KNR4 family protein [Comamonas sp. Y33R10-2]|uniref:SMI1/KNR4 family protein n=1 Tax=Comamonas sp. Y33R10-2 TaxID=2853257 RepID=UPI001C5CB240|nr:SMI1/KNR4 family protein [Comamonas sp. Y33R10-2]QXZ10347.1 SMI1/KNR4 family protein [Comamonas sp. Y33R10-2]
MQILFPNPFGRPPAPEKDIHALQAHIGFSDAYADFLRTQNGFSVMAMEETPDVSPYVRCGDVQNDTHANLRVLNSFAAQDPYYDLESLQAESLLADWFLEIGSDPGGNPFVEVLHGQHQGKIASLDHDLFAAAQDLPEFLADMELTHIAALSLSEQADALCDASLGLAWFHAKDMRSFVAQCIHCSGSDGDFWGFVVDEPGI